MTLCNSSETELKECRASSIQERESDLCERLSELFKGRSIRSIAISTGYHAETARRYIRGDARVPADFIAQVYNADREVEVYNILGFSTPVREKQIKLIPTHILIKELAHRVKLIEDATVTEVLLNR